MLIIYECKKEMNDSIPFFSLLTYNCKIEDHRDKDTSMKNVMYRY